MALFRTKDKPVGVVEKETALPEKKVGSVEEERVEEKRAALEEKSEDIFGKKYHMPVERFWRQIAKGQVQDKYGRTISRKDMKSIAKEMAGEYNESIGSVIGREERDKLIRHIDKAREAAKRKGLVHEAEELAKQKSILKQAA